MVEQRERAVAGFTMVELLATLLIVALASAIVAAGVPVAQRAYLAAVDASHAQSLLSTSASRLRDCLSVANPDPGTVKTTGLSSGVLVQFESYETGRTMQVRNTNEGLVVVEIKSEQDGGDSTKAKLAPSNLAQGAGSSLRTEASSISYEETGVFTVHGLSVTRDGSAVANATVDSLSIKVLGRLGRDE